MENTLEIRSDGEVLLDGDLVGSITFNSVSARYQTCRIYVPETREVPAYILDGTGWIRNHLLDIKEHQTAIADACVDILNKLVEMEKEEAQ